MQNKENNLFIKDVQNIIDDRGITIEKVGVSEVNLPFLIKTKSGSFQSVLANIKLTVDLSETYKGTHMSRFIEILNSWSKRPISFNEIKEILQDTTECLEAHKAYINIKFKYFIEKSAPITSLKSLLDYNCSYSGSLTKDKDMDFVLAVEVPFTSLCPCSKEISDYGAHNQRSLMKVKIKYECGHFVFIEDVVKVLEEQASAPIYPLLKRSDEKYITEAAYENPKFVEDIIRDVVLKFRENKNIKWFKIECENYESIHNHNAYACHVETLAK